MTNRDDNGIYFEDFGSKDDVVSSFEVEGDTSHIDIIAAAYTYENYSGSAFVLFRDTRDGKLYEVNGRHCSCYRLEGQWEPEETSVIALLARPRYFGDTKWVEEEVFNAAVRAKVMELAE